MNSLKPLLAGPRMKITKQQETFLELKWGGDYQTKLIDAYNEREDVRFSTLEKAIVLEWHMRLAGVSPR
jgi:hypothetical protein